MSKAKFVLFLIVGAIVVAVLLPTITVIPIQDVPFPSTVVAQSDEDRICPETTIYDGEEIPYVGRYSFTYHPGDGQIETRYTCQYEVEGGAVLDIEAADAWLAPEERSTYIPYKGIIVSDGYYIENGKAVHAENFEEREVTIIDMPQEGEVTTFFSELLGLEVVNAYCGEECLGIYATGGDASAMHNWQQNMKFYVLLADGAYIELALNPPPPPVCYILGIHFERDGDEDLLYVKIQDYDEQFKMSVWSITPQDDESFVLDEVDVLPYVEESYDFQSYAFADSGIAALVNQYWVGIFDAENRPIGRAHACAAG